MLSKLSLSLAAALLLSAGVARAHPIIPTSTDRARALAGQRTEQLQIDDTEPANGAVTSSDQARAEEGRSLPAQPGAWVDRTLAKDTDEGRAAAVTGLQGGSEKKPAAGSPAGSGTAAQGN
jgi:hypothetical protein